MAKKKATKKAAKKRPVKAAKKAAKKNPPPMRKVTGSTGWMSATAVKIVKRRGGFDVFTRKPAKKKKR